MDEGSGLSADKGPPGDDAPTAASATPPTQSLRVVPIERRGTDRVRLSDLYVEDVWCSVISPSGVVLARRLGRLVDAYPMGSWVDIADLAVTMGIGERRLRATVDRLVTWGLATRVGGHAFSVGVSGFAPVVMSPRRERLPPSVAAAHRRLTG
jgi:hypothetical protein